MTFELWIYNIRQSLKVSSDLNFQKEAWVDGTKFSAGWHEEVSTLYDSHAFEEFLSKYKGSVELPEDVFNQLYYFCESLNKDEGKPSDQAIIKDPDWTKIVDLAKKSLDVLDHHKICGKYD